jgi:membrane associated rhomboid family serine protease
VNKEPDKNINAYECSSNSSRNSTEIDQNSSHSLHLNKGSSNNYEQRSTKLNSKGVRKKRLSSVEIEIVINNNSNLRQNHDQNETIMSQTESNTNSISKKEQQRRPWFIWIVSIAQICVFIGEIGNNWGLTNRVLETDLSINPLFGPSLFVLINMGANFPPCMHSIDGITNNVNSTSFPCPNSTTSTSGGCTLSQLCGFNGVSTEPNQWYRFIISIFLHVGIVHILLNLFTQLVIAAEIERKIGLFRIVFIYFTSGIFGFIFGGNFASEGLTRMGCSGSLFAIIAISFLDLLYNWKKTKYRKIQLTIHIVDIIVNFVLGLLPGIDNFSHVGGFCMGLLLGSPMNLRRCKKAEDFSIDMNELYNSRWDRKLFHNRPKNWWTWWLIRFIAFAVAVVIFVLLAENFYSRRIKCDWCKYISCLPVNGWCDIGKFNTTNT